MRIVTPLLSQCIRIFSAGETISPGAENARLLRVIRAAELRYGFFQGPRTVDEFNPDRGIALLKGQFNKTINIDRFVILRNGLLAEASASTEMIDAFLDDVCEWGHKELEIKQKNERQQNLYLSQMDVHAAFDVGRIFSHFHDLSEILRNCITSYGAISVPFELNSFSIYFDSSKVGYPRPATGFQFARKEGHPFEAGLYFTSAPLRTTDHIRALNVFEELTRSFLARGASSNAS